MTTVTRLRLDPVLAVIEQRLGLRSAGVRTEIVADAIRAQMHRLELADAEAYARRLQRDDQAVDALAEALRVPETYFLREADQLEILATRVLPERAAARGRDGLRVWSAGCASGEEAYSLALVAARHGLTVPLRILATDRSAAAIAAARTGTYGNRSLRHVPSDERQRWFSRADRGWAVGERLRDRVEFRQHDLITDTYPADQDVVVCRNVLIYLTPDHGAAVVERLAASLAPGGWLVLGAADPHYEAAGLLEQVRGPAGSLYRRVGAGSRSSRHTRGVASRYDADGRRPQRPGRRRGVAARSPSPPPPRPVPAAAAVPPAAPADGQTDVAEALRRCEQELVEDGLKPERHVQYAVLLLESAQPRRAQRAATAAVFLDPDFAAGHLLLARAHLALQETARARQAFDRAHELLRQLPAEEPVPPLDTPAGRLLNVVASAREQLGRGGRP